MADVLAPESAVVGIIVAAFHSTSLLHDDFSEVKMRVEAIKPIVGDLGSVVGVLSSLDATVKRSNQAQGVASEIDNENFKAAAENCNRLVACKGTFTIALQMATFSVTLRQTHETESVIERLDDTNKSINQAGLLVRDCLDNLDCQLQRVTTEEVSMSDREASQVMSGSAANETSQSLPQPSPQETQEIFEKTWKQALAEIASHRIKIGKVTQASNAKAVIGVHGLENANEMNVEIDDVSVGPGSWSLVGVSNGVDLNAFFK
ncbi:hypothetical protein ACHAO1_007291 [Botrytis cinerea]